MRFISKANTLKRLRLNSAKIPNFFSFYSNSYNFNKIKKLIKKKIKGKKIIVRSSAYGEDGSSSSMAGKFLSIPNIDINNNIEIDNAINLVIKSYKKNKSKKNQILIQHYIDNIKFSGVITTQDIHTSSPYIIVNFSNENSSDAVTSGKKNSKSIFYLNSLKKINDKFLSKINRLIIELKKNFPNQELDIEFIIDKKFDLHLLQVRKLHIKKNNYLTYDYEKSLFKLKKKVDKLQIKHHNLLGDTTYFGVMPDWNPAEIIGIKPKPLALSLYQELITNSVWAENRDQLGYRNLKSNRLMTTFLGTPFIDLRVDFNSWIPKDLNENLANKLINYYLKEFKNKKSSHDKIEFDIVLTCYNNNLNEKFKKLKKSGFKKKEIFSIEKSLKKINQNIIHHQNYFIKRVYELNSRINEIVNSKMYYIDKIYWLIEDCKNYGTSSFAGLARSGFVSVDIMNSFVESKIMTEEEKNIFFEGIKTISSEILEDAEKLNKKKFIIKHGHLRPNSYEITSLNYKKGYNYLINKNKSIRSKKVNFKFTTVQKSKIEKFIKKSQLKLNFDQFIEFLIKSIQYREKSKYFFTKSINQIFEVLEFLGKRHSISIDKISYLKIQKIIDMYYELSQSDVKNLLLSNINQNLKEYKFNSTIPLPDIIYKSNDIYIFERDEKIINFVTRKKVEGVCATIKNFKKFDIQNKIVCIESADPGYDFIFSHKIKGLVTMYGGANSHMSIRCMELGIPAAIGVGKNKFDSIVKKKFISIDCVNKTINLL